MLDETPPESNQYTVTFLLSQKDLIGTIKPGKFHAVVAASGIVATSSSWNVICQNEGQSTINWILPDRSIVKKGDLVGQLDSRALNEQLKKQLEIIKAAEEACRKTRLTREVAEIGVVEYADGVAVQERVALQDNITLATAAFKKADDRLARTRRATQRIHDAIAQKKDAQNPASILAELEIDDRLEAAEENAAKKATLLNDARARLENHETKTVPAIIENLNASLVHARDEELAALSILNSERAKKEKLDRQIKSCLLYAPGDGVITHANDRRFVNRLAITNGATVRERQVIFRIGNLKSPLRVITRVPEWSIARVRPGVKARLTVAGTSDRTYGGTVVEVAPLPDVRSYFGGPNRLHDLVAIRRSASSPRSGF